MYFTLVGYAEASNINGVVLNAINFRCCCFFNCTEADVSPIGIEADLILACFFNKSFFAASLFVGSNVNDLTCSYSR